VHAPDVTAAAWPAYVSQCVLYVQGKYIPKVGTTCMETLGFHTRDRRVSIDFLFTFLMESDNRMQRDERKYSSAVCRWQDKNEAAITDPGGRLRLHSLSLPPCRNLL
jgi:hypothetical protein